MRHSAALVVGSRPGRGWERSDRVFLFFFHLLPACESMSCGVEEWLAWAAHRASGAFISAVGRLPKNRWQVAEFALRAEKIEALYRPAAAHHIAETSRDPVRSGPRSADPIPPPRICAVARLRVGPYWVKPSLTFECGEDRETPGRCWRDLCPQQSPPFLATRSQAATDPQERPGQKALFDLPRPTAEMEVPDRQPTEMS